MASHKVHWEVTGFARDVRDLIDLDDFDPVTGQDIFGSGMRIGHTASQRPQKVEAFGNCPPSLTPISDGVSTAPIGPG